jgi:hypothetical protein
VCEPKDAAGHEIQQRVKRRRCNCHGPRSDRSIHLPILQHKCISVIKEKVYITPSLMGVGFIDGQPCRHGTARHGHGWHG